jgi:hypothetical protein
MISGLRRCENEIVALLGGYTALVIGVSEQPIGPIFKGPIYCSETSVTNYTSTPHNIPDWRRSHDLCSHAYLARARTHTHTHTQTTQYVKRPRTHLTQQCTVRNLTHAAFSAPSFTIQSFKVTDTIGFSSLHFTISSHRPLPMRHVFPRVNYSYFVTSTCAGQQLSAIILTCLYRTNFSDLILRKTKYLH